MGWNTGYTIFEKIVVNLYNNKKLDKETLEIVANEFVGMDLDSGGITDITANDGKGLMDIICFMYEPEKYFECINNNHLYDYINEELISLYFYITESRWGF